MEQLTVQDLRRLLDFLNGIYALRNLDAFAAYLIQELPKVVPSEITAYSKINTQRQRITALVNPTDIYSPELTRILEHYIHEHPTFIHYQQTHNGRAYKISDFLNRRQFHRLGLYNEFFKQIGVEYQMALNLPAYHTHIVGIILGRNRQDFSERERLLLNLLRSHLIQAYQNIRAVMLLQNGLRNNSQEVVLITQEGRLKGLSNRARQWLMTYFGYTLQSGDHLPVMLYRLFKHQKILCGRTDKFPSPHRPLIVKREGRQILVRLITGLDPCLLILEEQCRVAQPSDLKRFGLTEREAEVLAWVTQGKTNDVIGMILGLSPRTVQKHIENIFKKLNVETRTAAAVYVLELEIGGKSK